MLLTPEQYLEIERAAQDVRSEYYNGRMYAMSGGTHPHAIDVLLCDVAMPERDGPSVAADLRRARPELRVVFQACDSSRCQPPLPALLDVPLTIEAVP